LFIEVDCHALNNPIKYPRLDTKALFLSKYSDESVCLNNEKARLKSDRIIIKGFFIIFSRLLCLPLSKDITALETPCQKNLRINQSCSNLELLTKWRTEISEQ
jgi:hypothetical protein